MALLGHQAISSLLLHLGRRPLASCFLGFQIRHKCMKQFSFAREWMLQTGWKNPVLLYRYHPCNCYFHPSLLQHEWGGCSTLSFLLSNDVRWTRPKATPLSRNWNPVFCTSHLALDPLHCLPGYFHVISLMLIYCLHTLPFIARQRTQSSPVVIHPNSNQGQLCLASARQLSQDSLQTFQWGEKKGRQHLHFFKDNSVPMNIP